MAKRCTRKEKQRRVEQLADLVIKSWPQRQLTRFATESWGLSSERARHYVREARDLVKDDLTTIDRADMLAAKVQTLEAIIDKSTTEGRESNAIGAIRLLNELVGFGNEQKK